MPSDPFFVLFLRFVFGLLYGWKIQTSESVTVRSTHLAQRRYPMVDEGFLRVRSFQRAKTVSFNLRVFTSKSGERCRNYNSLHMCLPLVKGPKVMGQLASQLFHGQVCVLFPHYPNYNEQIKGPEFISSVLFAFGICCCQLSR